MNSSRFLVSFLVAALGAALGFVGFVVLVLADQDRGAINKVFAAGAGAEYLLPGATVVLLVIVLATVLVARHSIPVAKIFGLSSVTVFGLLLILTALLASSALFAAFGLAVAVIGTASVLLAAKATRQGAV